MHNCNRPLYDQEVTVVIRGVDKQFLIRSLPRWFEQNYSNYKLVLVCRENLYSFTKSIASRYGIEVTCSHSVENSKCHIVTSDVENWFEVLSSPVVSFCDARSMPVPYYLDMVMMRIDYEGKVECNGQITTTRNRPENTYSLRKNLLDPVCVISERKCCVFIPVMNREKDLVQSLDAWLTQTYSNIQIVVIDYSSRESLYNTVLSLAAKNKKKLNSGKDSDILLLRLEGQKHFNISHAYNWAVKQTESDVLLFSCADSVPWDYYVETCMNLVDDKNFTQVHWGIHGITRENWVKLNGHQEFIVGWGAEDDDFRIRAKMMGLQDLQLPSRIVYQIPHKEYIKGENRQIKNLSESSLTNLARFQQYNAHYGPVGNYGLKIGCDNPVEYKPIEKVDLKIMNLYCFKNKVEEVSGEKVRYNQEFDIHYIVTSNSIQLQFPHHHFYIDESTPLEKYFVSLEQF